MSRMKSQTVQVGEFYLDETTNYPPFLFHIQAMDRTKDELCCTRLNFENMRVDETHTSVALLEWYFPEKTKMTRIPSEDVDCLIQPYFERHIVNLKNGISYFKRKGAF